MADTTTPQPRQNVSRMRGVCSRGTRVRAGGWAVGGGERLTVTTGTTFDRESVAILKGTCVTTTSSCARVGSFAAVGGTTADSPLRGCLQMDVTHTALRPSFSCFVVK